MSEMYLVKVSLKKTKIKGPVGILVRAYSGAQAESIAHALVPGIKEVLEFTLQTSDESGDQNETS